MMNTNQYLMLAVTLVGIGIMGQIARQEKLDRTIITACIAFVIIVCAVLVVLEGMK